MLEEEAAGATVAAAEAARWRWERSEEEGFLLAAAAALLDARWPGVWLRGMGGIGSVAMSLSLTKEEKEDRVGGEAAPLEEEEGAVGVVAAVVEVERVAEEDEEGPEIFWERMIFALRGEAFVSMMSLVWAVGSAMVDGRRPRLHWHSRGSDACSRSRADQSPKQKQMEHSNER